MAFQRKLFWPSSKRLIPAECARHRIKALSACFCNMLSGEVAISRPTRSGPGFPPRGLSRGARWFAFPAVRVETERLVLAPREEHRFEHGFGEPEKLWILRTVNQRRKVRRWTFVAGGSVVNDQTAGLEYTKWRSGRRSRECRRTQTAM